MTTPSDPERTRHDDDAQQPEPTELKPDPQARTWLNDLAQRSTGLPAPRTPTSPPPATNDSSLWKLAGLGVQFAGSTAIFAFIGNALDKKMGWSPWGLITLSLLAIIGNLYLLIKETLKQDNPTRPPPRK